MLDKLTFYILRTMARLLAWLPYSTLHLLGRGLGRSLYYLLPKFRKRTLSNLSLAKELHIDDPTECAKKSFENLAITFLEYAKLEKDRHLEKRLICENPEYAASLIEQGQGVIFFCAHQANWEALFLEGTMRMPGVAIGNSHKNRYLTDWLNGIRERFGGKIIPPQSAIKEGMRALKEGKFLGIVGDQALPSGGHQSLFLGTPAWTSPTPALLAYKLNCPIIYASIKREKGIYKIHYSDPIWPNKDENRASEVSRMMNLALSYLEESIAEHPDQWMWQHNRYKQETPHNVYYAFRQDTIAIVLPESNQFDSLVPLIEEIYPKAFLTLYSPHPLESVRSDQKKMEQLFEKNYEPKLVFDFSANPKVKHHYQKLSALSILNYNDLKQLALKHENYKDENPSEVLLNAICRRSYRSQRCPT